MNSLKELLDRCVAKLPYRATFKVWGKYWAVYGGFRALIGSFYFLLAVIFTAINYWAWSRPLWWDLVISAMPTLLGFTLAGLAVFLSMDSGFSKVVAGKGSQSKSSPFMALVTSFVHFIVVQTFALIYALTAKSLYVKVDGLPEFFYKALPVFNLIGGAIGYFLFLYAVFLILGATFAIFRSAGWFEAYVDNLKANEKEGKNCHKDK